MPRLVPRRVGEAAEVLRRTGAGPASEEEAGDKDHHRGEQAAGSEGGAWKRTAAGEEEEAHSHDGVRIDMEQTRTDLRGLLYDPLPGFDRLELRAGVNDYRHREIEPGGEVVLTRLARAKTLHPAIVDLLTHARVVLVGVGVREDVKKLTRDFAGCFAAARARRAAELGASNLTLRFADLGDVARAAARRFPDRESPGPTSGFGLKKLAAFHGVPMSHKTKALTMTNWEKPVLFPAEIVFMFPHRVHSLFLSLRRIEVLFHVELGRCFGENLWMEFGRFLK